MAFINLIVQKDARVNIENKQLKLIAEDEKITYPLEDMNSLMFESLQTNLSTYAINKLAEHNVAVYFCDEKHVPSALLTSFNNYYKQAGVLNLQLNLPKPLQKRLWQSIIIQKIVNQSKVLKLCDKPYETIVTLSKQVQSGDITNLEAAAASIYFKTLFGKHFNRIDDFETNGIINACLNYGYTIIRGQIARTLISKGFNCCLGLKHENKLNAFNLTDDIIEPFRPVIDLFVAKKFTVEVPNELSKNIKYQLVNLVNTDILMGNQKHPLFYAVEMVCSSLLRSLEEKENKLILPEVIPLGNHKYE